MKISDKEIVLNLWRLQLQAAFKYLINHYLVSKSSTDDLAQNLLHCQLSVSSPEGAITYSWNKNLSTADRNKAIGLSRSGTLARYHKLVSDGLLTTSGSDKSFSYWIFRLNVDEKFIADIHRGVFDRLVSYGIPIRGSDDYCTMTVSEEKHLIADLAAGMFYETVTEMLSALNVKLPPD